MLVMMVQIDGRSFFLSPEVDVSDLKRRLVGAALAGAAFVDFETIKNGPVSVLVTPHSSVVVEVVDRSTETMAQEHGLLTFDYDAYLLAD